MARSKNGNLMSLAVMSLLGIRPMHPYEMGQLMKQWGITNAIKVNPGNLYATINSLLSEGLIAIRDTHREGNLPERTVYAHTSEGVEFHREFLRDVLKNPVREYPRFVAGLSFLAHLPPDEVAALLTERAQKLRRGIQEARRHADAAAAQGVDSLFLIEYTYSQALIDAELAWIDRFLADLQSGRLTTQAGGEKRWTVLDAGWLSATEKLT